MTDRRPGRDPSTEHLSDHGLLALTARGDRDAQLSARIQTVAAYESAVRSLGDKIIRPAALRYDLDHDKATTDTILFDRLAFAANDRDLRLELRIIGDFGWRRRRFRYGLERRRIRRLLRERVGGDGERQRKNETDRCGAHRRRSC